MNEVAAAKFFGGQANCSCDFIQMTLQRKNTLWSPKSSESAVRWHVRRDGRAYDTNVRAEVRTGGVNRAPRQHHRRERAVGAAVDHETYFHRQELSVFRDCRPVSSARRMALRGRDHVFSAIVDHLDG